jgi:tRNA U34 5-methylaminomethyl-2-thiouridine-forming methyltransferase MnmC
VAAARAESAPDSPAEGASSWQPLCTDDGSWTLVHPVHGEACHSRSGAWLEARERYAVPCRLDERARELGASRPLWLLDIGTGPGWNIAAALAASAESGAELRVETFESERAAVAAGLGLPAGPRGAEPWWSATRAALALALEAPGRAVPLRAGGISGELVVHFGDARERLAALAPGARFDAVFLDPFSPGVDEALFGADFLGEVARRMHPRAVLSTFTSAFRVRRALCAAGLAVGLGPAVGHKRSGTLASRAAPLPPLRAATAARLAHFGPGACESGPPLA